MATAPKSRKGSKKVSNTHRSEHRKNRYQAQLRLRARRGDEKAVRMLDHPRKRAGKSKFYLGVAGRHRNNKRTVEQIEARRELCHR